MPYFVCVHGALAPWLNRRYPMKHLKKQLYWSGVEYRVLRDARRVLFASLEEERLARRSFLPYRVNGGVAHFGIEKPQGDRKAQRDAFFAAHGGLEEKRILLFLGRLHPVKGCDLLVEAFAAMQERDPRLHLVMAGPDEAGWRPRLMALARDRGVQGKVTWTGMLSGEVKWGAFHAADAFVLPSHSESFGVVVAEALSCGVPVLLTRGVSMWREVIEARAGLVEEDTLDGVSTLLDRWTRLGADEIREMRVRAEACFTAQFEIHASAKGFFDVIASSLQLPFGDTPVAAAR